MLKGDLVTTPLPQVLRQLADGTSSGCLHVLDARGEEGRVYLRGGLVYAVQVPGQRPLLGQFLVSSGALGPEMLAEALEAQRTELQGWKLGELLVHLSYVDEPVVEAFLAEQVRDQAGDLLRWPTGTWKFRVNERTREDVARPTTVEELLTDLEHRSAEWEVLTPVVHGPEAVPVLSAAGSTDSEMAIDAEAWSLLCKVDGVRTLSDLAVDCGFTLFEAAKVVHALVHNGLLEVEEPPVAEEQDAVATGSITSRLAAAFAPADKASVVIPQQAEEPSPAEVAHLLSATLKEDRSASALAAPSEAEIDGSIDRISAALSQMLGTTAHDDALFAPQPRRNKSTTREPTPAEREKAEREALRRARDAEELQQAQAELEAARRAPEVDAYAGPDAEIVSLEDVRREAARRDEEEAARAAEAEEAKLRRAEEKARAAAAAERAAEEQRLAAESDALAEEKAQLVAERARLDEKARQAEETRARREEDKARKAEEKRLAEEEKARRAEEKRLAAEAKALEDEKALLAAERARLEEEARLADEEAARLDEEERLAAEAEELEARLAEERAQREEEERLAAEAEFARLAEEQRLAAEAEQARLVEQARLDEQARLAEAQRLAEEQRIAADAEAQAEQARLAEADAARVAYEAEQARLQAEYDARILAEQEFRRATEAEAAEQARLAQEAEAADVHAAADAELDAQANAAAQRTAATDAFAELSAAASMEVPAVEPEPVVEPPPPAEPEPVAPAAAYQAPHADISSMFRELSEFNRDEEPAAPATPPPPVRTGVRPAVPDQKKRGLFKR